MRVAIVGSGISGIAAADRLHRDHEITVFESDPRIGGHAHTVELDLPDNRVPVDTGFIVYNNDNYPGFSGLLANHDVPTQDAEMSFAVSQVNGIEYRGSNPSSLFAQRRNLVKAGHWRMLRDITRFNRAVTRLVAAEAPWAGPDRLPGPSNKPSQSIEEFLIEGQYGAEFVEHFLIPFGSAIWSARPETFTSFPVESYARFMANHGLLGVKGRKQWRTISGGSREYLSRVTAPFADRIHPNTPVYEIAQSDGGARVQTARGVEFFDEVIIATHSNTALDLVSDPTPDETAVLTDLKYTANVATLPSDVSVMPKSRRAWASWNYHINPQSNGANVTYWMNKLQSLDTRVPVFVTLNRKDEIDPNLVHGEWIYDHPEFDMRALAAQRRRTEIQGTNHRWYAGAYWGYGFHEDGTQSGFEVARSLSEQATRNQIVMAA